MRAGKQVKTHTHKKGENKRKVKGPDNAMHATLSKSKTLTVIISSGFDALKSM